MKIEGEMSFKPGKSTPSEWAIPQAPKYWVVQEGRALKIVTEEPEDTAPSFKSVAEAVKKFKGARFEGQPEDVNLRDIAAEVSPRSPVTKVVHAPEVPRSAEKMMEGPFYLVGRDSLGSLQFSTEKPAGKPETFDSLKELVAHMTVEYPNRPRYYVEMPDGAHINRDQLEEMLNKESKAA